MSLPCSELKKIIKETKKEKKFKIKSKKTSFKCELSKKEIRSIESASEKEASSWLNATPLKRYHFDLKKIKIRNGITLHYY